MRDETECVRIGLDDAFMVYATCILKTAIIIGSNGINSFLLLFCFGFFSDG